MKFMKINKGFSLLLYGASCVLAGVGPIRLDLKQKI